MKFIGPFCYNAEVVLPRSRKPRRVNLFGLTEYTLEEPAGPEIVNDAVVIQSIKQDFYEPADALSLMGWDERLWHPMNLRGRDEAAEPTTPEAFVQSCNEIYPDARVCENPLSRITGYLNFGPTDLILSHDQKVFKEDDFRGKILWENRSERLQRHHQAMRDAVIINGIVYAARPEPVWHLDDTTTHRRREISLFSWPALHYHDHNFRLDRHADAVDYAFQITGQRHETRGAVLHYSPAFLHRDDQAEFLSARMGEVVTQTDRYLSFLPKEMLPVWYELTMIHQASLAALDHRTVWDPGTRDHTLTQLKTLTAAVEKAIIPTNMMEVRYDLIRDKCDPLFHRIDFERQCRPTTLLAAADHSALASLAI